MVAKTRRFSTLCALVAAVVVAWQANPVGPALSHGIDLRSTFAPLPEATTTIKSPVIELTDPDPFDPCRDIPLDVVQRIGLAYTPPAPEDNLRRFRPATG